MEIAKKIFSTIKNDFVGFAAGAGTGYYVSNKYVKNTYAKIGIAFLSGMVGTAIQDKIRSKSAMNKMKQTIQK